MSGKWEGSNRRSELPDDWPHLRRAVFERDGYQCVQLLPSGVRCPHPATDCDHIGASWDHSLGNLRSLCSTHHGKRSAAQGNKAKYRPTWKRPREQHPFDTL